MRRGEISPGQQSYWNQMSAGKIVSTANLGCLPFFTLLKIRQIWDAYLRLACKHNTKGGGGRFILIRVSIRLLELWGQTECGLYGLCGVRMGEWGWCLYKTP